MAEGKIAQMEPLFGEEEAQAVAAYMRTGAWLSEFERTTEFERRIADHVGARFCTMTNNGTISLTLAALALGVKAGHEVIVPNYTQIATPNSVKLFGATPVFVDVEPETLCLDIERTRAALTPRTRAIMLVAANGRYPKAGIEAFEALARERDLALIEDSAQALGARYPDGRHIGTAGRIGSFSFSVPKIVSTGQGGCLVTDDPELDRRLRRLKDFGRAGGGTDIHDTIGWNFKFTDLQAVVGLEQMKKLPARVVRKGEIYRRYRDGLAGRKQVSLFEQHTEHGPPWFIDTLVENRDGLMRALADQGIGTRVMYPPINAQKAYRAPGAFPVSEDVGQRGLWLPSAVQLTDDHVDRVCAAIHAFYG